MNPLAADSNVIHQAVMPRVESLVAHAAALDIGVSRSEGGTRIVDAGIRARGGLEAGRRIAEICLGGLGRVSLRADAAADPWSWQVDVHCGQPVLACLACQYAGWSLSHGEGKGAFFALGSGPARCLGSSEELFEELAYREKWEASVLVLETSQIPPRELMDKISEKCGIYPDKLTLILTPTSSLAGIVQIVSRVLETALHKAHALKFPLHDIVDGAGSAPLCPPAPGMLTAMSRSNDAILFGGRVQLFVDAADADAEQLARGLPCSASRDYGRPFAEVFREAGFDFYKIDPLLFSPASVTVSSVRSGRSFHAGRIDRALLEKSFSGDFG